MAAPVVTTAPSDLSTTMAGYRTNRPQDGDASDRIVTFGSFRVDGEPAGPVTWQIKPNGNIIDASGAVIGTDAGLVTALQAVETAANARYLALVLGGKVKGEGGVVLEEKK